MGDFDRVDDMYRDLVEVGAEVIWECDITRHFVYGTSSTVGIVSQ
jgi:hypothetical protein